MFLTEFKSPLSMNDKNRQLARQIYSDSTSYRNIIVFKCNFKQKKTATTLFELWRLEVFKEVTSGFEPL